MIISIKIKQAIRDMKKEKQMIHYAVVFKYHRNMPGNAVE